MHEILEDKMISDYIAIWISRKLSFLGEALIYLRTRHHNVYNTEIIQLHIQERGGYVLTCFCTGLRNFLYV